MNKDPRYNACEMPEEEAEEDEETAWEYSDGKHSEAPHAAPLTASVAAPHALSLEATSAAPSEAALETTSMEAPPMETPSVETPSIGTPSYGLKKAIELVTVGFVGAPGQPTAGRALVVLQFALVSDPATRVVRSGPGIDIF